MEKPIIFIANMVRAILKGYKTQTRGYVSSLSKKHKSTTMKDILEKYDQWPDNTQKITGVERVVMRIPTTITDEDKSRLLQAWKDMITNESVAIMPKDTWHSPTDRLPKSGQRVLAKVTFGTTGKPWTIIATYCAKHQEEADHDSFEGDLDYSEEKDQYYLPEGWYEDNLYTETNYKVSDTVVSWRPLPE